MKIFGENDGLHLHMWRDEDGEVTIGLVDSKGERKVNLLWIDSEDLTLNLYYIEDEQIEKYNLRKLLSIEGNKWSVYI